MINCSNNFLLKWKTKLPLLPSSKNNKLPEREGGKGRGRKGGRERQRRGEERRVQREREKGELWPEKPLLPAFILYKSPLVQRRQMGGKELFQISKGL